MNAMTLLIALTLAGTAAQSDEVYKWTDANGIAHYTDQPPPQGTKFDRVKVGTDHVQPTADSAASAEPAPAKPAATSGNAAAANADTPAQQLAKVCQQARSQLEVLQSNSPVSMDTKGDGTAVVLDEAARKAEIVKAQEAVASYCK